LIKSTRKLVILVLV